MSAQCTYTWQSTGEEPELVRCTFDAHWVIFANGRVQRACAFNNHLVGSLPTDSPAHVVPIQYAPPALALET